MKTADTTLKAVVHVFGSGHSVGFGMELAGRPGSLVPFHTIVTSDFVLHGKVSLAEFKDPDNIFERRADIADRLYDLYDIRDRRTALSLYPTPGLTALLSTSYD